METCDQIRLRELALTNLLCSSLTLTEDEARRELGFPTPGIRFPVLSEPLRPQVNVETWTDDIDWDGVVG